MALIAALSKEIHDGRDGDFQLGQRGRGVRRYTRVWRVVSDAVLDGSGDPIQPLAIANQWAAMTGIRLGTQHPTDMRAYCQHVSAKQAGFSKLVWLVTAAYSTEREQAEDPLAIPAEVDWDTDQYTQPYWRDRNGQAIVNSAGYYYDPPVEGDDSRWLANVSKNVAAVPAWVMSYRDATNSDTFTLDGLWIAVGAAKLMKLRISKWQILNDVRYRTVMLSIAVDEDGWDAKPLDQGLYEIDPASASRRRRIADDEGEPVDSPVPMDGAGAKLANPTLATAVFRTHGIYKRLPFSALPLV